MSITTLSTCRKKSIATFSLDPQVRSPWAINWNSIINLYLCFSCKVTFCISKSHALEIFAKITPCWWKHFRHVAKNRSRLSIPEVRSLLSNSIFNLHFRVSCKVFCISKLLGTQYGECVSYNNCLLLFSGHVTKELDERCYTPCAYEKLHENKGKRLEISSDFTEYHNGEVVKKLRRKVKGKKLEFSPKPYERISPNSTGVTVLNKSTSLRRPFVNLSNIKDSSKTHKSTENFWRPWR